MLIENNDDLEFINCVFRNDLTEFKRRLKLSANVNSKDYDRRTALHISVSNNN